MISLIVQITNIDNIQGVQRLVFGGPQSVLQHAYLHAPVDITDGTDCCRGPVHQQGTSRILTYRWPWTWSYAYVYNNHDGNHAGLVAFYNELPGAWASSIMSSHHIVYRYLHLCTQSTGATKKMIDPFSPERGPRSPQQIAYWQVITQSQEPVNPQRFRKSKMEPKFLKNCP